MFLSLFPGDGEALQLVLKRAHSVTFTCKSQADFLLPPTTTETVKISPACTRISVGQNLKTPSKSIYELKNQANGHYAE